MQKRKQTSRTEIAKGISALQKILVLKTY